MKHTDENIEKVAREMSIAIHGVDNYWGHYNPAAIVALNAMFTHEPAKPRECWVIYDMLGAPLCAYGSEDHAKSFRDQTRVIHMREVTK